MNVETNSHSASPTVVLGGIAAPKLRAVRPVAGMLARRSWIVRGRPRPTPCANRAPLSVAIRPEPGCNHGRKTLGR